MRRIWAPEWKYITEPSRPHTQILFQIHIELEVRRPQIWIWKNKTKQNKTKQNKTKTEFRLITENSHAWYITIIHEPTNEYA